MTRDGAPKRTAIPWSAMAAAAGAVLVTAAAVSVVLWLHAGRPVPGNEKAAPSVGRASRPSQGPDDLLVVVAKGRRRLTVFRGGKEIRSCPVVLGRRPEGDKQREGDGRTPEGTFYVCEKNEKSRYYLFIGLSYPNEEDADRGLRDGLITRAERDLIVKAVADRTKPPWYTRLGGEIGLHGGGTAWDWTEGCVGLDNGDMKDLYAIMRDGTTVVIEP